MVSAMQIPDLYNVIAWVAVKFGINTMSVVLEMGQISLSISNTTRVVFIPNFHCYVYPCYSMLIPYLLTSDGTSIYTSTNYATKIFVTLIGATL